jgi:hypothetical protein
MVIVNLSVTKIVLTVDNEFHYHLPTMDKAFFDKLKDKFGTHAAVAKQLGVSYTRYNEWRWRPECIPESSRRYLELFAKTNGDPTPSASSVTVASTATSTR